MPPQSLTAQFLSLFQNEFFLKILRTLWDTAYIWLPIVLIVTFGELWLRYIRLRQRINTPHTLLEIRFPLDIKRSPLAMETILNVMYHTGEPGTWWDNLIEGRYRPEFSLELASLEGEVHFYMRCRSKFKTQLESQIYSQYPNVEVVEVEDYAAKIQYDEHTMKLFGLEQKLEKLDAYPIKTYVDFGLDREQEEEYQVDPMNSIVEFMGSLGKGEYCFLQIIVRSHVPEKKVSGEKGLQDWQYGARKEVDRLLRRDPKTHVPLHQGDTFSDEEKRIADAIIRNIGKKPFDTGIRVIYFGPNEYYNKDRHSSLPTMFRSFQSHTLNNLKPVFRTQFDWWYQNPFGWRAAERKREIYSAYRWRSWFHPPYKRPKFVMSSEEIATIYHFPTSAVGAPGLRRITSRRGDAPANLPR